MKAKAVPTKPSQIVRPPTIMLPTGRAVCGQKYVPVTAATGSVRSIIVASSDKAYGDQEVLPYSEHTPLEGRHPYDVSKSCADLIAKMYAVSFEVPVAVTRCGNFYGGGDLNWNRLIPGTIRSALKNERPVLRSDGTLCPLPCCG